MTVEPITIVFSTLQSQEDLMGSQLFVPWIAEVEERSGGMIQIEAHWLGELAATPDVYDEVLKGNIDLAQIFPGEDRGGRLSIDEISLYLPYSATTTKVGQILWELHNEFPEIQAQYEDSKCLWKGVLAITGLATIEGKRVDSLEDLDGLTILVYASKQVPRFEAVGAVPVSVGSPGESYGSLQRGIVESDYLAAWILNDLAFGEVCPYVTLTRSMALPEAVVMNLDVWNSLPADLQELMASTLEDLVAKWDELQAENEIEEMAQATANYGTEFIELSHEELLRWDEADLPARQAFIDELEADGIPGQEIMDEYLRLCEVYAD